MQVLAAITLLFACASAQYYPAGFTGFYPSDFQVDFPYGKPTPFVAPLPFAAKTTFKTVAAEVDPFAKTPADTTKFDLKEKSYDVYSPVAYPYAPYPFVSNAFAAPVEAKNTRAKRQVYSVVPTKQFVDDLKYKSVDINQDGQPDKAVYPVLPYPYPAGFYPDFRYATTYPYYPSYPFGVVPFEKAVAYGPYADDAKAPVSVEAKNSRSKRQVFSVLPTKQFADDLKYKSVDINQDGQPDKAVYPASFGYSGYYPYTYPFYSGFYGY